MSAKKFGKNAEQIQGVDVVSTAPSDKEVFYFDTVSGKWKHDKTIVTTLGATDATVPTSKAVKDVTDLKVSGPASAIDGSVPLFDATTGKLIKDSGVLMSGVNYGNTIYGGTVVTDLDTINKSGYYSCYGTATSVPSASYSWWVIHQNSNVGTVSASQIAIAYDTTDIEYKRIKMAGTWGSWVAIPSLVQTALNGKAATNQKLDDFGTPDDNTDLNANTTNHGLAPKAVDPVTGRYINIIGIGPAETVYTNKALYDDSATPVMDGSAATGTLLVAARRDHVHPTDTSKAPIADPTFTGTATTPALKVTTGAAAGKVLVSDADGDLVYTNPKRTVFLSLAGGWNPTTSPAGAITTTETSTNKVNYRGTLFAAGTSNIYHEFAAAMPDNWDLSTITAEFYFHTTSTDASSHTIIFGLQGLAMSSGDTLDTAYGTAQEATATIASSVAGKMNKTSATSAITIGNTPAKADFVQFRVYRKGDDTFTGDVILLGVRISYGTNNYSDE